MPPVEQLAQEVQTLRDRGCGIVHSRIIVAQRHGITSGKLHEALMAHSRATQAARKAP